jgi:DNA-binding FadR family transcriptional regulator
MVRLKRDALSVQVVDQIGEWILSGKTPSGETLPSEQALSEQFGVSKTVVREAMKVLASKGLVTIRQGIGTTVNARDLWHQFDPLILLHSQRGTNFRDLLKARQILEPEVAAMACASSDDPAFMAQINDLVEKGGEVTTVEDHVRYDLAFHQSLADATGNQMLVIMMNSIGQFLRASREALFHVPGAVGRSSDFHREIRDAVARNDPDGARDAMRRHLQQVEDDYERLMQSAAGT